jgi:anti-sigma regulatory factor (Ser/Thr protein kinase)
VAHPAAIPDVSDMAAAIGTARTRLEPGRTAPALARRFAREVLAGHGAGSELLDRAQLLISELVTNAVVHARSPVWLSVTATDAAVHIEVEDQGGGRVARRRPGDLRGLNAGYGLWLVDSLADSWGVEHGCERRPGPDELEPPGPARDSSKKVWLKLPLPC